MKLFTNDSKKSLNEHFPLVGGQAPLTAVEFPADLC